MTSGGLHHSHLGAPAGPVPLEAALDTLQDERGRTLRAISDARPALVVLLRHTGCTFCRQALADLAACAGRIAAAGMEVVVIGMSDSSEPMRQLGARFGLTDAAFIADPQRLAYRALEVPRGSLWQLLGPKVLWAGLQGLLHGRGLGPVREDPFQMPGTVIIHRGRVVRRFIHQTAADRPDYEALACSLQQ